MSRLDHAARGLYRRTLSAVRPATRLGALVLMAFVLGAVELHGATAQAGPAGAQATQPAAKSLNDVLASEYAPGEEIPELRSRTSKTFAHGERGAFRAEMFGESVHYRLADDGPWLPVENELVAASGTGFAFRNKGNRFSTDLPLMLGITPVRLQEGTQWLSFALEGANGLAVAAGRTARYPNALPGVTAAYTAFGDGIKEELILAGATSPSRFSFVVRTSPGLSPRRTAEGAIEFADDKGELAFLFAPPSMLDAAKAFSDKVDLAISEAPGGWRVELIADRAWLDDPKRVWPVTIDPTTFVGPRSYIENMPARDCYIDQEFVNTSNCTGTSLEVGNDGSGGAARAMLWFDLDTWVIPHSSQVLYAAVRAKLLQATSSPALIEAKRVSIDKAGLANENWTTAVTWNTYNGTTAWDAVGGGGDVNPPYDSVTVSGAAGSTHWWQVTEMTQDWVEKIPWPRPNRPPPCPQPPGVECENYPQANQGVQLRVRDEVPVNRVRFQAWEYGGGTAPVVEVVYKPRTGELRQYALGDSINVTNGNVFLAEQDLTINGTGLDVDVGRFYNRLDAGHIGAFGRGWTMGPGRDVGIDVYSAGGTDGSASFYGPSGYAVPFAWDRSLNGGLGGFRNTLSGVDARLRLQAGKYIVRFNYSGEEMEFGSTGLLEKYRDKNSNMITYGYDANGKLTTITDTIGRVVTVTYNAQNLIYRITDWTARFWEYGYDASNRLTSVKDPLNKITTYAYDTQHRLTKITDPRGNETRYTYALSGSTPQFEKITVKYVTNPGTGAGFSWLYEICTNGNWLCPEAGDPDFNGGERTALTDPNLNVTRFYVNRSGAVVKVKDALGKERSAEFMLTPNANLKTYTNAAGKKTSHKYDEDDKRYSPTETTIPTGGTWRREYDTTNPNLNRRFDVKTTIDPNNRKLAFTYTSTGNIQTETYDPDSTPKTATFEYNPRGLLKHERDFKTSAPNWTTVYENDPNGTYGPIDAHLTKIIHPTPFLGAEMFTYDSLSRLKTRTDGKGQKQEYTYDARDRVTQIKFFNSSGGLNSTISYVYDNNGNVSSMTDNTGVTNYVYDQLDRLIKETLPGGRTTEFAYDGINMCAMRTRSTPPGPALTCVGQDADTTKYTYNAVNLVTTLTEPGATQTSFAYDDDYNRKRVTFPAGASVSTCSYYDDAERLTTVYSRPGSSCLVCPADLACAGSFEPAQPNPADLNWFQFGFKLGAADTGLRQTLKDKAGNTTTYTYDQSLGRLQQAQMKNAAQTVVDDFQYVYDANSNRTSQTVKLNGGNPVTATFQHNAADQLTGINGGPQTYLYDLNGSETSITSGRSWVYNPKDQATSFTPAGLPAIPMTYTDTGQYKRATAGTAIYTNDSIGVSREVAGSTTTNYTRMPDGELLGFRRGTSRYNYLLDGLGSVDAVIDQNGNTAATFKYEPFGKPTCTLQPSCVANAYRWLGSLGVYWEADSRPGMELYKMGTRWYDPSLGRFTQVDPIKGGAANRYDYARQDPINSLDPRGTLSLKNLVTKVVKQCNRFVLCKKFSGLGPASEEHILRPVDRTLRSRSFRNCVAGAFGGGLTNARLGAGTPTTIALSAVFGCYVGVRLQRLP